MKVAISRIRTGWRGNEKLCEGFQQKLQDGLTLKYICTVFSIIQISCFCVASQSFYFGHAAYACHAVPYHVCIMCDVINFLKTAVGQALYVSWHPGLFFTESYFLSLFNSELLLCVILSKVAIWQGGYSVEDGANSLSFYHMYCTHLLRSCWSWYCTVLRTDLTNLSLEAQVVVTWKDAFQILYIYLFFFQS